MKRLAVLGHPVSHSRSPAMQTAALDALGLADEWSYEALDLEPAEFDKRVRALAGQGYAGANVTIPFKEAALRVANEASDPASEIRAANTLTFGEEGIRADNTDAAGLLGALQAPIDGKAALVLGAGGSARAAVWALAGGGAAVSVWNRTPGRAEAIVRELGAADSLVVVEEAEARAGSFDLIVNCTAVGMKDEDPFEDLPLEPDRLTSGVSVVDLVYAGSESRLVTAARERGAIGIDGLEVLVRQGGESLRIWTGMDPPLDVMREAARGGEADGWSGA